MKITNTNFLNFSATIPKIKLQVQNKTSKEFIPATFYLVDGEDILDYKEFQLGSEWEYGDVLSKSTQRHHSFNHHYKIKTDNNETIAICRVGDLYANAYDIEYLESKPNSNYKYSGRAILACIAKEILNWGGNTLKVLDPLASAYSFYEETCGFNCKGKHPQMNKKDMEEFITRTEKDIGCELLDIKS